jgi:hypothetical protein
VSADDRDAPYQASGYCSCCGREDPWAVDGYTTCCNEPVNDVGGTADGSSENRWGWTDILGRKLVRGDVVQVSSTIWGGEREASRYVVLVFTAPELWGVEEGGIAAWDGRSYDRFLQYDEMARVRVVGHVTVPDEG